MSIASDFRPIEQGFSEPASPEMPLPDAAEMPTEDTGAALSQPAVDTEPASEVVDEPVVTEEQLTALRQQGYATPEDLSRLRSTLDGQVRKEREAAIAAKRQADTVQASYQTVVNWLQQNAEKYGIEEGDLKELGYMIRDQNDQVAGQYQQTQEQAEANTREALGNLFQFMGQWAKTDTGDELFKVDDPTLKPLVEAYSRYAYHAHLTGDQRYVDATDQARNNLLAAVRTKRDQALLARGQQPAVTATAPQPGAAPQQRRGPQNTARGGAAATSDFSTLHQRAKQNNPNADRYDVFAEAWAQLDKSQ